MLACQLRAFPLLKSFLRRFSVYGDFWMHLLHTAVRVCPWFLEPFFILGSTFVFWVFCGKARNAVAHNLKFILPGSSSLSNQVRAFRVFWNFAWSITDLARVQAGQEIITWDIVDRDFLHELEIKETGAVLLTAHMGNYDIAAPVFAGRFKRPIHMVRAPERQQENQELQHDRREQQTSEAFVIHYNEPGSMLGVELVRAISEGGIVAIQGDRIMFDVAPMKLSFKEGVTWQVPRGPFTLAMVARTSIHPVFIIRLGYRRYRVQAFAPIIMAVEDGDKESAQMVAANQWNAILREVIEQHWWQWFVFEPVFEKEDNK